MTLLRWDSEALRPPRCVLRAADATSGLGNSELELCPSPGPVGNHRGRSLGVLTVSEHGGMPITGC